jgi:hypothetical protein
MLTFQELEDLRARVPADPDLARLLDTLRDRSMRLLVEAPIVPRVKAFLSRNGGVCPDCGGALGFDPWSPERHGCTRCGHVATGDRHHRHWARAQHLWLAERMAELALLSVVAEEPRAADRAAELLAAYEELYFDLPNRDNVLGPSHLFFSTYLESLWLTSFLAAAFILRESGQLSEERTDGVNRVADEAAQIIGDFNEGFSNRQTWHAAALTAIAAWFGDAELAKTAVESRTGLVGHLAEGFGEDGLWWEGENYHLFALRGLMQGIHWARSAGYDLLEDAEVRRHFRDALLAPARTALPDFTYPARRDSRYGVSLADAPSVELWEIGRGWLGGDDELNAWLGALYDRATPGTNVLVYDAWLHDAGRPSVTPSEAKRPSSPPSVASLPQGDTLADRRSRLSWWALTAIGPAPDPGTVPPWNPASILMSGQGLAVLRHGDWYASLECGRDIGGHGHPDRLHLTLHAGGAHWLPDPGTGSYVEPVLEWYRSALAHNAPRLDGINVGGEDAWCSAFEASGEWAWCRAKAGRFARTLIASPGLLLDVLEVDASAGETVDLPWHFIGTLDVISDGAWKPGALEHPFVSDPERFVPAGDAPIEVRVTHPGSQATLSAVLGVRGGDLLRARAPGLPGTKEAQPFLMITGDGRPLRWVTVLRAPHETADPVPALSMSADQIEVASAEGVTRYHLSETGATIERAGVRTTLGGIRLPRPKHRPFFKPPGEPPVEAAAPFIHAPPPLDGTLAGFDTGAPLELDAEHQYLRSEEPFDSEAFSARAWLNWDGAALFLAVAVAKSEVICRPESAASLELDNEPEDVNSDGLQVYLSLDGALRGTMVLPQEGGGLYVRQLGPASQPTVGVQGAWSRTELGYVVTLRLDDDGFAAQSTGSTIGFDLLVNEMRPGRLRRAGQLAWSGGGGWIYLRGDRHDTSQLGVVSLG